MEKIRACSCCGLVQRIPTIPQNQVAICSRCQVAFPANDFLRRMSARTTAIAASALILFPIAVSMPILIVEKFGHKNEASILEGCTNLFWGGHIVLSAIIFFCSLVLPMLKLVGLIMITQNPSFFKRGHRAWSYHLIEKIGRWGMLDVFLVAIVTALVKLGDLVQVKPGPGVVFFSFCVILSLLATFFFDPQAIWYDDD